MRDAEAVAFGPSEHAAAAIFEDEVVLYQASSNAVVLVNGTAGAVWQRCDGRTPLGDVIDALARSFGASRDEVAAGVHALVAELTKQGLLIARLDDGA